MARRHHGRRPAVLPAVEQPPVYAGVRVRHAAREGHSRGLHPGGRGADPQGAQSSPVRVQSLFRGWYKSTRTNLLCRSIGIVFSSYLQGSTVLL